jgi:hypothetical protein
MVIMVVVYRSTTDRGKELVIEIDILGNGGACIGGLGNETA